MRRNSLSQNDLVPRTPHTIPASVLGPPTPDEVKEMAKNLRSRKIKLITKHLRQSKVISIGLVVVLTCLLSAGAIEIYLRFFFPEAVPVVSVPRNSSSKLYSGGGGSSGNGNADSNKTSNNTNTIDDFTTDHNTNQNSHVRIKTIKSPLTADAWTQTTGDIIDTDTPISFVDASTQTISDDGSHQSNTYNQPTIPTATVNSAATLNADSMKSKYPYFGTFLSGVEIPKTHKLKPGLINFKAKFDFKAIEYLVYYAIPFEFLVKIGEDEDDEDKINDCFIIVKYVLKAAINSPIMESLPSVQQSLTSWQAKRVKISQNRLKPAHPTDLIAFLHEFAAYWNQICVSIRSHPLHSPFIKTSENRQLIVGLDVLKLISTRAGPRLQQIPRIQTVIQTDLNSNFQDIFEHLGSLIKELETINYSISYVHILPKFQVCYIKENNELVDLISCLNLHIHYYNELVDALLPSNTTEALKKFNRIR